MSKFVYFQGIDLQYSATKGEYSTISHYAVYVAAEEIISFVSEPLSINGELKDVTRLTLKKKSFNLFASPEQVARLIMVLNRKSDDTISLEASSPFSIYD